MFLTLKVFRDLFFQIFEENLGLNVNLNHQFKQQGRFLQFVAFRKARFENSKVFSVDLCPCAPQEKIPKNILSSTSSSNASRSGKLFSATKISCRSKSSSRCKSSIVQFITQLIMITIPFYFSGVARRLVK